jgi:hypothetical protein
VAVAAAGRSRSSLISPCCCSCASATVLHARGCQSKAGSPAAGGRCTLCVSPSLPMACPIEKQGMPVRRSVPAAVPLLRHPAHAAAALSGAPAAAAEQRAHCRCARVCQMQQLAREQSRRASAVIAGDRLTLLCRRLLAQPSLSNRSAAAWAAGSAAGTAIMHHAAMLPCRQSITSHSCQLHT